MSVTQQCVLSLSYINRTNNSLCVPQQVVITHYDLKVTSTPAHTLQKYQLTLNELENYGKNVKHRL